MSDLKPNSPNTIAIPIDISFGNSKSLAITYLYFTGIKIMKKQLLTGAVVFGTVAIASLLQAAPATAMSMKNDSSMLPKTDKTCDFSDVLLGGSNASKCFGQITDPKNDVGKEPTLLTFLNENKLGFDYSGQWIAAGKEIQNGSGTENFANGEFTSTSESDLKSGTWSLELDNQLIKALVISVKGGPGYSAYLFEPSNLKNVFSGDWTTLALENNGGQQPGLSHISAYYVTGEGTTEIPTPALLPGLIGMSVASLRKKKKQLDENA